MNRSSRPSKDKQVEKTQSNTENPPENTNNSPLFPCYLCGKQFFVPDIYEHEVQCLKMWQEENSKLPPQKRKKIPQKQDIKFTPSGGVDFVGTFNRIWENHLCELEPCKMCGRTFAPDRLKVHEKACKGADKKKREQGQSNKP